MQFLKKNRIDFFFIFLISLTLPLFFYKLGQSSLISFDEAWYGGVAKNIIKTGNLLNLTWNGAPYIDHPPTGFWLMAVSIKIMGDNEFAVRFPSAFLGFLSLIVIYFLGKELFKSAVVGFCSALILGSSFWFLFRARSGNLDVPLTFFFLLTFYLAWKKFLLPWSVSLILLFLTKTLVPLTIIPSLIIIFGKKIPWKYIILTVSIFGGWMLLQILKKPDFVNHYLGIGLPGVSAETNLGENFKLIKEYLHSGIGKWFWLGIVAVFLSFFLRQKRFFALSLFFLVFFLPFIFSQKGHIWHLIPLYPILALSVAGFFSRLLPNWLLLLVVLFITIFQIQIAWRQFIDIPAFISDEAILSREAAKLPGEFFIDGDFLPTAYYYSGKKVVQIKTDGIKQLFEKSSSFSLITKEYRLKEAGIAQNQYKKIKADRDKILIAL